MIYFKRDIRSLLCEVVLPCLVVVFGLSLTMITFIQESPTVHLLPENFPTPMKTVVSKNTGITDTIANDIFGSFTTAAAYTFLKEYSSNTPTTWDAKVFSYKDTDSVGAFFIDSIVGNNY